MSSDLISEMADIRRRADQAGSFEWLDWLKEPSIIIDNSGNLVALNPGGRARLEDGFPFRMIGTLVSCVTDTLAEELKHAIQHQTRFEVIERHPESNRLVLIRGSAFGAQFYLRLTPLEREASLFSHLVIGNSFQLTRAETRVLSMIFADLSAAQIAERLGLSVETVRTHRKRVYAKLGVNGRASVLTLFARAFEV